VPDAAQARLVITGVAECDRGRGGDRIAIDDGTRKQHERWWSTGRATTRVARTASWLAMTCADPS